MDIHLPDIPATTISVSPSNNQIVLASKAGLSIVNIEALLAGGSDARFLSHTMSWEVADVAWNPHKQRETWIASTSNQKVLVYTYALEIRFGPWLENVSSTC